VEQIQVRYGRAEGVRLASGENVPADCVLASGGMKEVFFDLVGQQHLPPELTHEIEQNRLMESVLMVHLGIDFDPTPYQPAALCYYYQTNDLEAAVHRLRTGFYHEGREGFLIYVPSLHSPELAPPGMHALTIYTVAPDTLAEGTWAERKEELADKLVAEAEQRIPGLRQRTCTRLALTPDDFRRRTHLKHHSFGGLPPVMGNRPPKHKTPIAGLWFIGAQSESAGGVQNVMVGAHAAAQRIIKGK
jgi:phytoene dehydrogenase-like protein